MDYEIFAGNKFFSTVNQLNKNDYENALINKNVSFGLNNTEIRETKSRGRGVFSILPISKGEIVTFFPCDILMKNNKDGTFDTMSLMSNDYFIDHETKDIMPYLYKYSYKISNTYTAIGHPCMIDNPTFLGHMINDFVKFENESEKGIELYEKLSKKGSNCELRLMPSKRPVLFAYVATREILTDEEIYTSYGIDKWKELNIS